MKQAIGYRIPHFTLMLVRDSYHRSETKNSDSPEEAVKVLLPSFKNLDREHFKILMLNSKGGAIGIHTVSIGTLSEASVHPREVFKPAILGSASSIIVSHNHPSGDTQPSKEDLSFTKQLVKAGEIIGIPVIDHIILTDDGQYTSFAERNLI